MKVTILDQIEVTRTGHLQVRMMKQLSVGGEVFDLGYHRTIIPVGGDVYKQISLVNDHLAEMGFGPLSDVDIEEIKSHAEIAATPERLAAYIAACEEKIKTGG